MRKEGKMVKELPGPENASYLAHTPSLILYISQRSKGVDIYKFRTRAIYISPAIDIRRADESSSRS